jgi:hypothetical protein
MMPPPPRRGSRSRGFAPPELRGALGSILRTTLAQASAVRDALERGAREGRARLDDARIEKRRTEALADLGEVVLSLVRRGKLPELEEHPQIADAIAAVDELEPREPRERDRGEWVAPQERSRFDRGRRNVVPVDDAEIEDGTVTSSAGWTPPRAPQARVWRPPTPSRGGGITFAEEPPTDDSAGGDEDDLAEYMHPDDVPPRRK